MAGKGNGHEFKAGKNCRWGTGGGSGEGRGNRTLSCVGHGNQDTGRQEGQKGEHVGTGQAGGHRPARSPTSSILPREVGGMGRGMVRAGKEE